MRKIKPFVDLDKEETWLNAMAAQGHLLAKAGIAYTFAPIARGTSVIRIDYQRPMSGANFDSYRRRLADSGWRHVDGSKWGGRQYFASLAGQANADVFSDKPGRERRHRRALAMRTLFFLLLSVPILLRWTQGPAELSLFSSPKDWYLTPGLWDLQGASLLFSFLIETPFVLFRIGAPLLVVAVLVLHAVCLAYHYVLHRRRVAWPAT